MDAGQTAIGVLGVCCTVKTTVLKGSQSFTGGQATGAVGYKFHERKQNRTENVMRGRK